MAPASGVLLERKVDAGALVGAGAAGFVLGDVRTVKARFGVPDSIVQTIAIGEPIAISVDALSPTPFAGRISAIAPAADPQSRVFDIEVAVANGEGRLRPGMIGTVALGAAAATSSADAPLTAPLTAIVRPRTGNGQYAVLVVERRGNQDVATLRPVQLGEVLGNAVAILSGLTRGDRIVVSGAALLADGDPVRIVS
jgi:RND family efflux transporter MFP subunit